MCTSYSTVVRLRLTSMQCKQCKQETKFLKTSPDKGQGPLKGRGCLCKGKYAGVNLCKTWSDGPMYADVVALNAFDIFV